MQLNVMWCAQRRGSSIGDDLAALQYLTATVDQGSELNLMSENLQSVVLSHNGLAWLVNTD